MICDYDVHLSISEDLCVYIEEVGRLRRLSESQARDLKKILRESAQTASELEKALVEKSDECEVSIYSKVVATN
jgi:hypothetical protein